VKIRLFFALGIVLLAPQAWALVAANKVVNVTIARTDPHGKLATINMELTNCNQLLDDTSQVDLDQNLKEFKDQMLQFKNSHIWFCGNANDKDRACKRQRQLYECYLAIYKSTESVGEEQIASARELSSQQRPKVGPAPDQLIPEGPPEMAQDASH
jgi:hypothetical protein